MHNMIQIRKFRKINQKQKTQGWKIYEEKKIFDKRFVGKIKLKLHTTI